MFFLIYASLHEQIVEGRKELYIVLDYVVLYIYYI